MSILPFAKLIKCVNFFCSPGFVALAIYAHCMMQLCLFIFHSNEKFIRFSAYILLTKVIHKPFVFIY